MSRGNNILLKNHKEQLWARMLCDIGMDWSGWEIHNEECPLDY